MSDYSDETAVDRREETVTTQQPGFASTEQSTRDVAAERRMGMAQWTRIIMLVLGILEILLGLRVVLKLIAADPNSGFAVFIYGLTALFVMPFAGLVATYSTGGSVLEVTTLIAMAIYGLFFWGVERVFQIMADRPTARVVSRSTREETPGGERTTTTRSN